MDRRPQGFTLIELMIAIAIIAIIAAIAIPNLIESRKGSNEAAAIGALRTLATAQSLFREGDKDKDGVLDYALSLSDLRHFGLIDSALATAEVQGYVVEMTASDDRLSWQAVACPGATNRSGGRCFFIDQTNLVTVLCPPGQHLDPAAGQCVSDETSLTALALGAIRPVNDLTMGLALPMARTFVAADEMVQDVLRRLDLNADGRLTFDEVLSADIFETARAIVRDLGGGGRPVGNDKVLQDILRRYQEGVRRDLALGVAGETTLPAVQLSDLHGDPAALLSGAASCPPTAPGC